MASFPRRVATQMDGSEGGGWGRWERDWRGQGQVSVMHLGLAPDVNVSTSFLIHFFSCLCTAYAAVIMHISPLWYKLMHSIPFHSTAREPFSRRSSIFHQLFYCLLSS